MNVEMFLMLLAGFTALTTLTVEGFKKIVTDRNSSLVALITALVIGTIGTGIYYYLTDIAFTGKNIVCMALMGLASGLTAMTSYDKLAKIILSLKTTKEE